MNNWLLILFPLFTLGWVDTTSRESVCTGRGAYCYTIFKDTSRSFLSQIDWSQVNFYYRNSYHEPSTSWSFSTAEAASVKKLMVDAFMRGDLKYDKQISPHSIQQVVMENSYVSCGDPTRRNTVNDYRIFPFLNATTNSIYDLSDWPYEYDNDCDESKFPVDKSGFHEYYWSYVTEVDFRTMDFFEIRDLFQVQGMGIASIKAEYTYCCIPGWYKDTIYSTTNKTVYDETVSVHGYWEEDDKRYVGIKTNGPSYADNVYLWVPFEYLSDTIAFIGLVLDR